MKKSWLSSAVHQAVAGCLVLAACVNSSHAAVNASSTEIAHGLFTAGICRIESERSYKLSLQIALGVLAERAKKELDRSLQAITGKQKLLDQIDNKSPKTSKALARANNALNDQFDGLQKLNASNAGVIYDVNEDLLNKLNSLAFSLEYDGGEAGTRTASLALRQASLAQRMAKIVLLRSLDKSGKERQGLMVDLVQSKNEFSNGLDLLALESQSSPAIKSRIDLARAQWLLYESALRTPAAAVNYLRDISTTSDRISDQMLEIVHLSYAVPLNKLPGLR